MTLIAINRKQYNLVTMIPFVLMHAAVLLAFTVPFKIELIGWLIGSYYLRMFAVTAGYHRYFSHRAFKLIRAGVPGANVRTERRALVGGPPPRSS
jgi:stearoyl-CoA desaturase (Delta-9 desaturase)